MSFSSTPFCFSVSTAPFCRSPVMLPFHSLTTIPMRIPIPEGVETVLFSIRLNELLDMAVMLFN